VNDNTPIVTPISPGAPQPQPTFERARPAGRSGCLVAWAVAASLAAVLLVFFVLLFELARIGAKTSAEGPSSLHEKFVEGEGDAKVALIELKGIIMDTAGGGLFGGIGETLTKRIQDQLEKAQGDDAVKAVLFDVDSPGGAVTPSDQIHHLVTKFRAESKKPVIIHQGALAASGGYYVSAAGDEIWAEHTTITGSIGVIMEGLNLHDFLENHGVKDVTIKSGPNKDLMSSTGPIRPEHLKILQETVDDMYARFCDVVAEGIARRTKQKVEDVMPAVKQLADGRIYTAKQALELHLVDGIGYFEDAFDAAKKRANVTQAKLVRYKKEPSLGDILSGNAETRLSFGGVRVDVDRATLEELATPHLLVLWDGR
jgi:protease-4